MKRKKKRKLKKSVKKLLILIPIIAVIAIVCVYGFALKDVSYSSDLQQYIFKDGLKISANKCFVSTDKHIVVTALKPRLAKGLKAISAEVLTNIEKTRLNDILITNHFCFFL